MNEMAVKRRLRQAEEDQRRNTLSKSGKLRKRTQKRDAPQATASQAVLGSDISVRRTSKKINYEALLGSFDNEGKFIAPNTTARVNPFPIATDRLIATGDPVLTAVAQTLQLFPTTTDPLPELIRPPSASKRTRVKSSTNRRSKQTTTAVLSSASVKGGKKGKSSSTKIVPSDVTNISTKTNEEDVKLIEDNADEEDEEESDSIIYRRERVAEDFDEEYY
jgi:hypothetical protein